MTAKGDLAWAVAGLRDLHERLCRWKPSDCSVRYRRRIRWCRLGRWISADPNRCL